MAQARRIRQERVAYHAWALALALAHHATAGRVTVSIGLSTWCDVPDSGEETLVAQADARYRVKCAGLNRSGLGCA